MNQNGSNIIQDSPKLGDDTCYETWKNEMRMWQLVTDLHVKKQALAVALSLSGKAWERALELSTSDLNTDTGIDILFKELDLTYKKTAIDNTYEA